MTYAIAPMEYTEIIATVKPYWSKSCHTKIKKKKFKLRFYQIQNNLLKTQISRHYLYHLILSIIHLYNKKFRFKTVNISQTKRDRNKAYKSLLKISRGIKNVIKYRVFYFKQRGPYSISCITRIATILSIF